MDAFDQLQRVAMNPAALGRTGVPRERAQHHKPRLVPQAAAWVREHPSATDALLSLLRTRGPLSTPAMAQAAGLATPAVADLLKHCLKRGQVQRADDVWTFNPHFVGLDVLRAMRLLRSRGWTVLEPGAATEAIAWTRPAAAGMPDADITVLLHVEGADEPVWPGWWDGERWIWADGQPVEGRVIEFADLPGGSQKLSHQG